MADIDESKESTGDGKDVNREMRAAARRFDLLVELKSRTRLTLQDVAKIQRLQRRFPEFKTTYDEDFKAIISMFSTATVIPANDGVLEFRGIEAFGAYGPKHPAKHAIAKLIIDQFLNNNNDEVIYLSTGTTVYHVANALVAAIESKTITSVRRILTDNLAIVDLFCQRATRNHRLKDVVLTIIGGDADFEKGDVALGKTFAQLSQWEFSTAIVSATKINPLTGTICSFRQPETKVRFFKDVAVGQLIIPVLSNKISRKAGGRIIFRPQSINDPRSDQVGKPPTPIIVTEKLEEPIIKMLRRWYDVSTPDDAAPQPEVARTGNGNTDSTKPAH
jgi:hypothetical protein